MTDGWEPIPDPHGDRVPPRRRPPTAVGLLTPPPPPRPSRSAYRESTLRQRLAQGFVGATGAFAGIATTSLAAHPAAVVAGAVLAVAAATLLGRAVRPRPTPQERGDASGRATRNRRAA